MTGLVSSERVGKVLRIVLTRPKVNAISRAMSRAIYDAVKSLQDDPTLAAGIITAEGERVFCAGWDFAEASSGEGAPDENQGHGPGGFAGITKYWGLTKPLVCAVNGAAIGGGFELALACDVILMAETAWFQLPEMQRGILPDAGGVQRLPRRIPYNVAMDMILSGRRMEAAEAERWGLAAAVVPADRLQEEALAKATAIAEGAPLALAALKEVMAALDGMPLARAMAITGGAPELPAFSRMWASEDAKEGPRAFLEKRPPRWQGR